MSNEAPQQEHSDRNSRRKSLGLAPAASSGEDCENSGVGDEPPELLVAASPAPPTGSFCPAIIVPTRAPSALAAAAAVADCSAADSFLGFGLGSPPQELWNQEEEPASGGGGRGRAPSADAVDLGGGGCDLGWGELDDLGDIGRGRGRGEEGEEEEEEDTSCADGVEGR